MAQVMEKPTAHSDESFWQEYHKQDKKNSRLLLYSARGVAVLVAGLLLISFLNDDDSNTPEPVTPTTVTAIPEVTTTVATTTPEVSTTVATTLPPALEKFSFLIGVTTYDCEVVTDPLEVVPGDHIWGIVDAQELPEDMPQRWVGTIDLNQLKGTVGANPNLIYPGDEVYILQNCVKTIS